MVAAGADAEETRAAVVAAISALDRAAKVGAIHPNAADRRKSRLMRKVNAALGGEAVVTGGKVVRPTGKAAAAKEAKARIAAVKASKAKGEQTAAGKARAALSKSTRAETAPRPKPTADGRGGHRGNGVRHEAAAAKTTAEGQHGQGARPRQRHGTTKAPAPRRHRPRRPPGREAGRQGRPEEGPAKK